MDRKKLDLCKNGIISIKNEAITAKQTPMTLQEARLLRLVIMQISKYDNSLMEYETTIPELADFLGITSTQTLYDDMFNICDKLTSQKIAVKTESSKHPWSFQPWMSEAIFNGSTIKLSLNEKVRPYVMQFNKLFTQYEMNDVLRIRSYYALRIYEILKMKFTSCKKKKNSFEFSLEQLRELTGTEEKFKQNGHFKLKVIDIAEREINEKTDLNIKIEMIKESRKYIGVRFIISEEKKKNELSSLSSEPEVLQDNPIPGQINLIDACKITDLLTEKNIPCSDNQAEQLLKAYDNDISERFLNNLDYVSKNKNIIYRVAYLLKIAKEDIAKEPDRISSDSKEKGKPRKTKSKKMTPISESRKQAYVELEKENQFAQELWTDLNISEMEK